MFNLLTRVAHRNQSLVWSQPLKYYWTNCWTIGSLKSASKASALGAILLVIGQSIAMQNDREAPSNPVYLADAPVAIETIERALDLTKQGSHAEAARTLQTLIVEHGDRLTPSIDDPAVSIPVRSRIEGVLQSDPELLEAYQRIHTSKAQRLLEDRDWNTVWKQFWLTEPGYHSGLNHAQVMIESARFSTGLRTLTRLADHPDSSKNAQRAINLAQTAWQGHPSDESREVLLRWYSINGQSPPNQMPDPFTAPPSGQQTLTSMRWTSIDTESGSLSLDGIVSKPIAQSQLTEPPASDDFTSQGDQPQSGAVTQPKPWAVPVIYGDRLLTNDGVTISCFDRFTLRPIWRVKTTSTEDEELDRTSIGIRSRLARTIEDVSTVTVHEGIVYVAAGLTRSGGRSGDNRLLALDLETGTTLHQTTLEQLNPTLIQASIRGAVIIDDDTIIVAARKHLSRERLVALSLVGIDRYSFDHKWTREIGSAGTLPFQQVGQIAHSGVLEDGVLYWTDMMGLVCTIDTSTGDLLWARAMPTTDIYARYEREPWTVSTPIVRGDSVFVLGANGQDIIHLNKHTGELIQTARAMTSGQGLYLAETPTHLVCVNKAAITLHEFERFGVSKPRLVTPTGGGRSAIRGRVLGAGSDLIVPTPNGLSVLDTLRTGMRDDVGLEFTGNVIAMDGQIITVDENTISSYLSWDIARELLSERAESMDDVHAAITLADLSYRSDHHEEILPMIDRAIELVLRSRTTGSSFVDSRDQFDARDRLFDVMLQMVGLPDRSRPGSDPIIEADIRDGLLQRSGTIARSVDQRLAQQMTMGAWHKALGQVSDAILIYHNILQDSSLSTGMWDGGGLAIRAEIEATHQIDTLVQEYGRDICRVFDDLAAAEFDDLTANTRAERFEDIARMYPWALVGPSALSSAATRWSDANNAPASVRAAQKGVDRIKRFSELGIDPDPAVLGALGSSLVSGLLDSQRPGDAARAATQLTSAYPSIELIVNGNPIDAGSLALELASGQPAPIIGDRLVMRDQPTLLAGSPVKSPIRNAFDTMVFFAPQLAQARMVQFIDSQPQVLWTRRSPDVEPPVVVVHNEFHTVLLWAPINNDPGTGWIESIETMTGESRWRIEGIVSQLIDASPRVPDSDAMIDGQFASPTEGAVYPTQILNACDGSVLVMVDRIGRGIGIDVLTGRVLWNADLPINRVYDMDLAAGVMGVVGMRYIDDNPDTGEVRSRTPRVASVDARTGQTIQMLDKQTSTPRWTRVAPSGSLIVGTSQRVLSVSTRTGTLDWVIRNDDLFNTNAGWIIDDTLIVLDEFVSLYPIGLSDGRLPITSLNTTGRIIERGWVDVRSHNDTIAIAASGGIGAFEHNGTTLGLDPDQGRRPYIGAAWARDRVVLVGRATADDATDDATMEIPVKVFDQHNGRMTDSIDLKLPSAIQRQPTIVQACDGVVVVGFGEVSVMLESR